MAIDPQQGDVFLFQTNNGGDICINEGIVEMRGSLETSSFLAIYGGNVADRGDQDGEFTWWGNLDESIPARKQISRFQNLIQSLPLTSKNLLRAKDALMDDLKFLLDEGTVSSIDITLSVQGRNTLKIEINPDYVGETQNLIYFANWERDIAANLLGELCPIELECVPTVGNPPVLNTNYFGLADVEPQIYTTPDPYVDANIDHYAALDAARPWGMAYDNAGGGGAITYVNPTTGSDSNTGASSGQAVQTIGNAIIKSVNNGIMELEGGTYPTEGTLILTLTNFTIRGPNVGVNPVTDFGSRVAEAILEDFHIRPTGIDFQIAGVTFKGDTSETFLAVAAKSNAGDIIMYRNVHEASVNAFNSSFSLSGGLLFEENYMHSATQTNSGDVIILFDDGNLANRVAWNNRIDQSVDTSAFFTNHNLLGVGDKTTGVYIGGNYVKTRGYGIFLQRSFIDVYVVNNYFDKEDNNTVSPIFELECNGLFQSENIFIQDNTFNNRVSETIVINGQYNIDDRCNGGPKGVLINRNTFNYDMESLIFQVNFDCINIQYFAYLGDGGSDFTGEDLEISNNTFNLIGLRTTQLTSSSYSMISFAGDKFTGTAIVEGNVFNGNGQALTDLNRANPTAITLYGELNANKTGWSGSILFSKNLMNDMPNDYIVWQAYNAVNDYGGLLSTDVSIKDQEFFGTTVAVRSGLTGETIDATLNDWGTRICD